MVVYLRESTFGESRADNVYLSVGVDHLIMQIKLNRLIRVSTSAQGNEPRPHIVFKVRPPANFLGKPKMTSISNNCQISAKVSQCVHQF